MMTVTPAQKQALNHVTATALQAQPRSLAILEQVFQRCKLPSPITCYQLRKRIGTHARITLNFHPDRLLPTGITVVEGLVRDGVYLSQFQTKISNGSTTAFPGGDRDTWEQKLFGGAYHVPTLAQANERPTYGGLNLMCHPDGASPRFGSCYIRLRPQLNEQATFTWGDSYLSPDVVGSMATFEPILKALVTTIESNNGALGVQPLDVPTLVHHIEQLEQLSKQQPNTLPAGRTLDDYIEAQVHGTIHLATDVESVVIDPSFRDTVVGDQLLQLAETYKLSYQWHAGFVVDPRDVPDDFRGPRMPALAHRVCSRYAATPKVLDAAAIGRAAASLVNTPHDWQDWASPTETLQHIKQLWHILVWYGSPQTTVEVPNHH
jgi:ribosomal protein S18 acetylase RimI-like enzyme